ncbi:hypothetical protein SASPL_100759 [Salvia splendens]|uniref:Uncharacterized protein n=1 Tax=Salvia splendens TaxID=180675 RepID=A0A8X8YMZ9_SALSN|nr:hypothetical protein SASPL_100759 [Salvia splendens]
MSDNIPNQNTFLYASIWTHEMDSVLLGTMIRLKLSAALEGTYWNAATNIVIVAAPNWPQVLERNPLLGACYRCGDPAYNQLNELFGLKAVKEERKLMFGEGSLLDRESTNKKVVCYYGADAKGKLERKVEEESSRVLPRLLPPNNPTLAYSCASNSPRMYWRVLWKPHI